MLIVLLLGSYLKPLIHGLFLSLVSIVLSGVIAILLVYCLILNIYERKTINRKILSYCKLKI